MCCHATQLETSKRWLPWGARQEEGPPAVNLGVDLDLSLAVAMIPYCAFDVFAMLDTAHWTPLAASFLLLDGAAGGIGILAYMGVGSKKAKTG